MIPCQILRYRCVLLDPVQLHLSTEQNLADTGAAVKCVSIGLQHPFRGQQILFFLGETLLRILDHAKAFLAL